MTRAARGIIAVTLSLGLNLGLLWGIFWIVAPRAVEDQELPNLDLGIEAIAVPQSTAQPTDPTVEPALSGQLPSSMAQGGTPPESHADAMSATGAPLTEAAPAVFAAAGARPTGVTLSQSAAPVEGGEQIAAPRTSVAPQPATSIGAPSITVTAQSAPSWTTAAPSARVPAPQIVPAAQARPPIDRIGSVPLSPAAATEATTILNQPVQQSLPALAPAPAATAALLSLTITPSTSHHDNAVQAQADTTPALLGITPLSPVFRITIPRQTAPRGKATTTQVAPSAPQPILGRPAQPATSPGLIQSPRSPTATRSVPPKAPRLSLVTYTPRPGAAVTAQTNPAANPQPSTAPARQSQLKAPPVRVALSWSGTADMRLDAQSLGALEAFLTPETPQTEATRDRIERLLTELPCARLQTQFDPESGALELIGHVPEAGLTASVTTALAAQIGNAIPVRDATQILPAPPCRALAALDAMALPQSDEHNTNPAVIGVATFATVYDFAEGDPLVLALTAPTYPSYLYVDYYDADGQVIHLQPNDRVPLRAIAPDAPALVGASHDGWPALNLTIAPPFGQDMAVALAVSAPLFDAPRPLLEPADQYLKDLHQRIETLSQTNEFRGEWAYFLISTHPR